MRTTRQQIAELISLGPMSARELAGVLGLKPKEVEAHLAHLGRSYRNRLVITPPRCIACGYTFRGRSRLDAPSRCPRCKAQRIAGPWFRLTP